jgi:citrate lyase beta subunit
MWQPSPPGQPLHTYYVAASQVLPGVVHEIGRRAGSALAAHAPEPGDLAAALGLDPDDALQLHALVANRLAQRPVEDLRFDFEDGLGFVTDAEEDALTVAVAAAAAAAWSDDSLPGSWGLRIKPFGPGTRDRAVLTLDRFLTAIVELAGAVPPGFVVTLPKVEHPGQPAALAEVVAALEDRLRAATLRIEIMIESTGGLMTPDGRIQVRELAEAGGPRCTAVHFGTYDYSTSCGIPPSHQHLRHPACDFARMAMINALAGTRFWRSDGSTNQLPEGDRATVHAAWRRHFDDVTHSLAQGYVQGWDLHPAQLVTRYAAVLRFHLSTWRDAAKRLASLMAASGASGGAFLDDPATGASLLASVRRAVACGAVDAASAAAACGMSEADLTGTAPFWDVVGR